MHYINLGILIGLVGLVIGFYINTDKKMGKLSDEIKSTHKELSDKIDKQSDRIDNLSDEIKSTHKELSDEIKSTHKELSDRIDRLSDRMDRLYDIQVHAGMGLRPIEHKKDKAANE